MTQPTVPATPLLTTVPRVELGAVGRWNISNLDGWEPSPADFANCVAALGCPAVRKPVLKFGHTGKHGAGQPAIGWIDNMAITGDGQVLVGDYAGIPAWLGDEDAEGRSVLASAYPDRSGEWEYDYVCQLGHTHPMVLHAMSLLGVERPGIGTLASLHDLYVNPPATSEEPLMPAASLSSADGTVASAATTDDVRQAYYAGPGQNWDLYIREMYVDPPELIVQNDATNELTRVSYVISADGAVTFGEPQVVKVQYVAARTALGAPVLAYATHAEARPGNAPAATKTPAAEPAADSTNRQEGAGMDPAKLREALGLSADASDDDVRAAVVSAGLASAIQPPPSGPPAPPAEAPAEQLAASAPRAPAGGVVTIDASQLAEFQRAAREMEAVKQRLQRDDRDKAIASAISSGKFPPARKQYWERAWDADPEGTRQTIDSLQAHLVPMAAAGYAGGDADAFGEAEFDHLFPPGQRSADLRAKGA